MARRARFGSIVAVVLPCLAVGVAATAMVVGLAETSSGTKATTKAKSSVRKSLTASGVRGWLLRAGLDPKALAASGISDGQAATLVGHAVDYIAENSLSIEEADAAVASARADVSSLENKVMGGMASPEEVSALFSARGALSTAQGQLDGHLQSLFTAAVAGVDESNVTTLQAIKANKRRSVPLEYTVLTGKTSAQWIALRDAISAKHIAQRQGQETPGPAATLISGATTEAVTAAATNLAANAATVASAWNTAVNAAEGR